MIYLGSDHGGYQLKEKIKTWLGEWKMKYEDLGATSLNPDDDYPQFAFKVAQKIAQKDFGVLICRSASGMVIAANKFKNVRAAAAYDVKMARHIREHNDANILAISADWTDEETARKILKMFLETKFSSEPRHRRRVKQIADFEKSCCDCDEGKCCGEQV